MVSARASTGVTASTPILFFGEDWGRHASTGQFLATEFATTRRVLWVNSLGLRAPHLNRADLSRAISKLRKFIGSGSSGQSMAAGKAGVTVLTPVVVPYWRYRGIRALNRRILASFLGGAIRRSGPEAPIIITACPSSACVMDALPAAARVYYCADEYAAFPGMEPDLVRSLERELISKVDLVVVTSRLLQQRKSSLHRDVRYLPHGVDHDLFASAARGDLPRPADLSDLGEPLVGYIGLIGPHLDFELLRRVAGTLPHARFIMIGPIAHGCSVPRMDNVVYLGPKARHELPPYLAHFRVCIAPYADTESNRYANPTKCREYLAAGCPVVSTPQAEASLIEGAIHFASTSEEFTARIDELIRGTLPVSREEISRSMQDHTWRSRADALLGMVDEAISRTGHRPERPSPEDILSLKGPQPEVRSA